MLHDPEYDPCFVIRCSIFHNHEYNLWSGVRSMLLARDFDLCCVIRNLIYVAQSRARSMLRSRGRYMSVERGIGSVTLFGDR